MTKTYDPHVGEAAWLYAKAGWPVCPLHDVVAGYCSCSDGPLCRVAGKHPRLRVGFHGATTDTRKVEQWWTRWPRANIAVVTGGPHGLVAIDLDGAAGYESWQRLTSEHSAAPATAVALSPHGRHLWYRLPSGLSVPRRIGNVAEHVDILGDGGYGIVPPSVVGREHPDRHEGQCSGRYQWTSRRAHIAELPAWIAELANRRDHTREGMQGGTPEHVRRAMRQTQGREYGQAALHGETVRVATATSGARNVTLNTAAYRLGRLIAGGELDRADAERALWAACEANGLISDDGESQTLHTIASGLNAGARRPRSRQRRQRGRGGRLM